MDFGQGIFFIVCMGIAYSFGYMYGRSEKIWSSRNFSKDKENTSPYYNKDTNTYSVPTGGSLEGMPYPHHLDKK